MFTTRLKFLALPLAAGLFLSACEKDDETPLTADQAQEAMASVDTELANELEELSQAEGFVAMQTLSGLSGAGDPFPLGRAKEARKNPNAHVRKAVVNLRKMISEPTQSARVTGDEPFNYNENKGVYEWNFNLGFFQKKSTSNIIEIKFPTEGSTTNDAVFRLTEYKEVATPDGDEAYSPTVIEATLDIDNVKQASLSVDVEYKGDGTDDPKFADITYFVNPYTIDLDLDDRSTSTSSFSQYLSKGGEKLIGWSLTATYQGPKVEENISKLVGTFQLSSVVFTIEISSPTSDDINDFVKISIAVDGKPAGNIVWVSVGIDQEPTPYIKYTDGSQEPLANIFESLGAALAELDLIS
jgi:hypothetical protein